MCCLWPDTFSCSLWPIILCAAVSAAVVEQILLLHVEDLWIRMKLFPNCRICVHMGVEVYVTACRHIQFISWGCVWNLVRSKSFCEAFLLSLLVSHYVHWFVKDNSLLYFSFPFFLYFPFCLLFHPAISCGLLLSYLSLSFKMFNSLFAFCICMMFLLVYWYNMPCTVGIRGIKKLLKTCFCFIPLYLA